MWETLRGTLDIQIATLDQNSKFALRFGTLLLAGGVAVTIGLYVVPFTRNIPDVVKFGTGIVEAAIGFFQYRPFATSRERSSLLRAYRTELDEIESMPDNVRGRLLDAIFDALKEMGKR